VNLESKIHHLKSINKKWWFFHQSKKECQLGSDGVGHDLIHPADKLESACRNCWTHIHSAHQLNDAVMERELDIEETIERIDELKEYMDSGADDIDGDDYRKLKRLEIKLSRLLREQECNKLELAEKIETIEYFYSHIEELEGIVKAKYKDHDDALDDMWTARIAYNAMIENHPLGRHLKLAIMDEGKKHEVLSLMQYPKEFQDPTTGKTLPMPVPDADQINKLIGEFRDSKAISD
jgi:hypothetical protein